MAVCCSPPNWNRLRKRGLDQDPGYAHCRDSGSTSWYPVLAGSGLLAVSVLFRLTPVAVLPVRVRNGLRLAGSAPLDTKYAFRNLWCVISSSVLSWMYRPCPHPVPQGFGVGFIPLPPGTSLSWMPPSSLYWIQNRPRVSRALLGTGAERHHLL